MTRSRLATVLLAVLLVGVPAPTRAATVTLIGAGDIATCNGIRDSATARLSPGSAAPCSPPATTPIPMAQLATSPSAMGRPGAGSRTALARAPAIMTTMSPAQPATSATSARAGRARGATTPTTWARGACTASTATGITSAQAQVAPRRPGRQPQTCVAAKWHHPRFSSGKHGYAAPQAL